jgi:hypothetical protein
LLLPPGALPPEFWPGRSPAVGGDGVLTVVALAELPPLTVMLGPAPPLLPVPVPPLPDPLPLPAVPPDEAGVSEVAGAISLGEAAGDEVAGEVLTSVDVVVEVLESAPLSSLLQPESKAIVAAAEETVRNAVR